MEAIVKVLYETDGGGKIVRSPNTLGGYPRLPGTRISVSHIVNPILHGKKTIHEMQANFYKESLLDEEDIKAAIRFYLENPDVFNRISRRNKETDKVLSHKKYICECGKEWLTPSNHFKSDEHNIVDITYEPYVFICECGEEFEDGELFLKHKRDEDGSVMSEDSHWLHGITSS